MQRIGNLKIIPLVWRFFPYVTRVQPENTQPYSPTPLTLHRSLEHESMQTNIQINYITVFNKYKKMEDFLYDNFDLK